MLGSKCHVTFVTQVIQHPPPREYIRALWPPFSISTASDCSNLPENTISTSSVVSMEQFKRQKCFKTVVVVLAALVRVADTPPMRCGGSGRPLGLDLHQTMPITGQRQQSSGLHAGLKYSLDEEIVGYFRGKWYTNAISLCPVMHCNS